MSGEHPVDQDAIRSEAVTWFLKRQMKEMTPDDEPLFSEWVNQSPAHLESFRQFERVWYISGFAVNDPVLARMPYRTDLDDGVVEEEESAEQSPDSSSDGTNP